MTRISVRSVCALIQPCYRRRIRATLRAMNVSGLNATGVFAILSAFHVLKQSEFRCVT